MLQAKPRDEVVARCCAVTSLLISIHPAIKAMIMVEAFPLFLLSSRSVFGQSLGEPGPFIELMIRP
jgi:hypothetical protein